MTIAVFEPFHPIAAIALTPQAIRTLAPLCQTIGATLHLNENQATADAFNLQTYSIPLKDHLTDICPQYRAFIFCLATGAVIRLISPLLSDKEQDPAVLVLDPAGQFVISLCGGHQGGGDRLTQLIAQQLGATPIITGASASLNLPAIDTLGIPFGWRKGQGDWTGVSAALAKGETIQVIQETGSTLWQQHLPASIPFDFGDTPTIPQARLWISVSERQLALPSDFPQVQWHPRVLWVGIGCIRGTSKQMIASAIAQVCQQYHLAADAIAGIATIDLKADEAGLLEYCQERQFPLKTFPPDVLRQVSVPNPSSVVEQEVGTPSVAEAAAICAVSPVASLLVPKQVFKSQTEAVTVAIAQAEREYTGRTGKLWLVGMGPGSLDQITPAAKTALVQADALIGYSLYLDLIAPLLRPGQIVEAFPITQEKQRSQRAIELATWGLTVAVVSSGDCGIYGMAGLVLEDLQASGWDGKTPQIEVFPGITALQAAAARVGAPLMHDFCAISLSDLLTPWEVIKKRLEAAAMGDFVTAIYNPRSQTRTQQIIDAQAIFVQYRAPQTPVAIVRSAYRHDEQIALTTLAEMLHHPIDMLTTVIIGNSSTRHYQDWLITPRGYII